MDDLLPLIQSHLDGELTEDQSRQLEQILRDDPDALDAFVETCRLDQQLRDQLLGEKTALRLEPTSAKPSQTSPQIPTPSRLSVASQHFSDFFTRPTPFSMTAAALFMGLLITALAFTAAPIYERWQNDHGVVAVGSAPVFVAELTDMQEAVWAERQVSTHRGAHLVAGQRMNLTSGIVTITFRKGVRVVLEGPTDIILTSDNQARLESGKLLAKVPPPAMGFAVVTEHAIVTDLGTEFGILVDEGTMSTQVVQGVVNVQSVDASSSLRLLAGEACTVAKGERGLSRHKAQPRVFARAIAHLSDQVVTVNVNFRSPEEPTHTAPGWNDITRLEGPQGLLTTPSGRTTDIRLEIVDAFGWLWPSGRGISQPHRAANGVVFPAAVLTDIGGDNYAFNNRNGIAQFRLSSPTQHEFTLTLAVAAFDRTEKTLCNVGGQWSAELLAFENGQTVELYPDPDGDSATLRAVSQWDAQTGAFVLDLSVADAVRNGVGAAGISAVHFVAVPVLKEEQ